MYGSQRNCSGTVVLRDRKTLLLVRQVTKPFSVSLLVSFQLLVSFSDGNRLRLKCQLYACVIVVFVQLCWECCCPV